VGRIAPAFVHHRTIHNIRSASTPTPINSIESVIVAPYELRQCNAAMVAAVAGTAVTFVSLRFSPATSASR
jgi:hypothetical protein